jgi:hypothetical protein
MNISKIYKQYNFNFNWNFIFILLVILFVIAVFGSGCKSSGVSVRHYKKIAYDVVPLDNEEKKNIMAQKCDVLFPIKIQTITKDSVVYRPIKVIDNSKINQLRKEVDRLKSLTPNVDLDSLYQSFYDSVLNDLPECKQVEHYRSVDAKGKDTTGNYFRALEQKRLQDTLNDRDAKLVFKNQTITNMEYDKQKLIHEIDVWKKRFFILLAIVLLYVGLRFLANKFTLPFKIQ